jgi:hypothetical protein
VPGSASCSPCPPGFTSNASHTQCIESSTPVRPKTWGSLKVIYR